MKTLQQHWFLIGLVGCLVLGVVFSHQLEPLARQRWLRQLVVATVMFLMAWPLETTLVVKTLLKPWPALLASVMNLGLLPLLAMPLSLLQTPQLATGLIVTAAVPCTLAAATVWTRRAGGNDAVAMMTTVITNGICFLITPLWIVFLANRGSVELSLTDMMNRLLLLVLLPMTLAQLTRLNWRVGSWTTERKRQLTLAAMFGILFMVTVGSVEMGLRVAGGEAVAWLQWLVLAASCALLHFGALAIGLQLSTRLFKFSRADAIAVGFAGSQKTLMVGLMLCLQIGVSVLPIVVYHAIQLIGDTPIADRLGKTRQ